MPNYGIIRPYESTSVYRKADDRLREWQNELEEERSMEVSAETNGVTTDDEEVDGVGDIRESQADRWWQG